MSSVDTEATEFEAEEAAADEREADSAARLSPEVGVLVPYGGVFEGQVAIVGPTRIEGRVRGSVRGNGDLRIGNAARVEGRIECDALESDGEIQGPVAVRTRARFGPGARLDGDLEARIVAFDEEAVWNGRAIVGDAVEDQGVPRSEGD